MCAFVYGVDVSHFSSFICVCLFSDCNISQPISISLFLCFFLKSLDTDYGSFYENAKPILLVVFPYFLFFYRPALGNKIQLSNFPTENAKLTLLLWSKWTTFEKVGKNVKVDEKGKKVKEMRKASKKKKIFLRKRVFSSSEIEIRERTNIEK